MESSTVEKQAVAAPSESEIVGTLQESVSASRLSLFLQCRLRFYFRYVAQIRKPKPAALHVGSTVHSALKSWNKARWRKEPLTPEQLHAEYDKAWKNEEHAAVAWEDGDEAKQQEAGWALVEAYLKEAATIYTASPDAVEVPVEADLAKHGLPRLVGVLDLVQRGVIIKYKNSASPPKMGKAA